MKKTKEILFNERGFTLIEMMIVLMIISALLLIAIPTMSKNNKIAQDRGCDATIELLQAQVGAYQIEKNELPADIKVLLDNDYVNSIDCPDGTELMVEKGKVIRVEDQIHLIGAGDDPTDE